MHPIHFTRPDQREVQLQPWSDHDLDQMSQITEDDISKAKRYWSRHLPARFKDLLNAVSRIGQR